ncbi:MAG: N-acetyltransferase [Bacilli bacterium]|nr:N-acetyltransferase [Bacilli bacterium]MBN2877624.1 N-acetyltransferase [Bacilli bacterium]
MEYIYEANRIYAEQADHLLLAEVTFPSRDANRVNVDHVYVDASLRGQGVASELMLLAYNYIKEKNLKIIAKCPYAIAWFKRNEQYQDIVINVKTNKKE